MAGLAESIETGVTGVLNAFITTTSANISVSLIPLALTGATIYVFMIGWAVARGDMQNSLNSIVWKFFRIALIAAVALGGGAYQAVVIDFIQGIESIFQQLQQGFFWNTLPDR